MRRTGPIRLAAVFAVAGIVLAACSTSGGAASSGASAAAGASTAAGGDKGTVTIAVNEWVGAEANVAVVSNLLSKLGYTVKTKTLAEEIAWQGFDTGEIDVILENWGHPDLEKLYFQDKKVAVDGGPNGVTGVIGWYVPHWMVEKYPDITDWKNLNKYADLFKTSESGDKGQFLASDPTFVTNDEALIVNNNLNYKAVYSGSEATSVKAFQAADKNKTPLVGYFYTPQWLNAEVKLDKINFPAYTAGCDADPKKVACDYPPYTLNKAFRTAFMDKGGDAATLVKNFSWTNEDQNTVADYIANKGMSAEAAAQKWIDDNQAKWQAWMPAQ